MISTTLLFFLIREIRGLPSGYSTSHFIWDEATVAAATFAIHPVHTEAVRKRFIRVFYLNYSINNQSITVLQLKIEVFQVANISGRAELLMSVFALTSILYYNYCLRKRVLNVYNMTIIFIIVLASIFSKEQGVTVLVSHLHFTLPHDVLAEMFQLASYCYQWLVNIRLLLLPYSLCFDYSMGCVPTVKSWSDYEALSLPLLLLIVLFIIVLLVKIHDKLLHFGIFFGILTFLPASNLLVTVGFTVAERVLYLPSIGVCVCGAVLFDNVQRRFKNTEKILLALFVIAMTKSYQRSEEWRTELDLYSSGLRVCINNAKIHYNLGKVLAKIGDVEGAEYNYWNAIRLNPHYEHAMNNLANILEVKGRYRDAELLLRKAIRSKPTFAAAWMNLGITLMNQNKFEDALESFNESLRLRPSNADCFFNIGNLYQKIGQSKNAIVSWENAIRVVNYFRLNPTHSRALINLFVMLDELEKCELVVEMSRNLPDKLASNEAALTFQIGICLGKMKKFQEAELRLKTAIRLNPQNPLYYTNLGMYLII
ncbi:tetratricopeptide repeat protein [Dictyocaulus viviparus]|uniref:dolichyl-phosphate-mannose--protein mannosyltransferase n=1 Tax=Dictyocaulus viviparus TaxID=29172 RepID=A0A0D8Y5Y0_DICVI|nr:tetratricopeptide repeat protein [Dictyocaulus viviparus]